MKKRIAILANHSGGLYDFRKDLISELKKHANVTVAVPHNDRWEELHKLVDEVIELPVDRRGMNPIHDSKLFRQYRAMLKEVKPDLALTYTIKPNIYGGLACRMAHIPYAVNITGLGSAIENGGWLKKFVLALYKPALKGARVVFFENAGNRVAIVKPAEGKTDEVKAALEAYVASEQQSMEHYLEDQYLVAKAATVTVAPTGEVVLVCAEDHDTILANIEKALAA